MIDPDGPIVLRGTMCLSSSGSQHPEDELATGPTDAMPLSTIPGGSVEPTVYFALTLRRFRTQDDHGTAFEIVCVVASIGGGFSCWISCIEQSFPLFPVAP